MKRVKFRNIAKDFDVDYIYKGMTKSGHMRVQEIIGEGPSGVKLGKGRIAKLTTISGTKYYKIHEGGSPLNTYFREFKKGLK